MCGHVQYSKIEKVDRVYDFLAGLNSKFDVMQRRILGKRPIPSLVEVCYEERLEEDRVCAMNITTIFAADAAAFRAKLSGSDSDK